MEPCDSNIEESEVFECEGCDTLGYIMIPNEYYECVENWGRMGQFS